MNKGLKISAYITALIMAAASIYSFFSEPSTRILSVLYLLVSIAFGLMIKNTK
jgi:hypothetical protein